MTNISQSLYLNVEWGFSLNSTAGSGVYKVYTSSCRLYQGIPEPHYPFHDSPVRTSKFLGRLEGFEPSTSRTTIWRYYQLSYSRRKGIRFILAFGPLTSHRCPPPLCPPLECPPPPPLLLRLLGAGALR
jgi:hypothetical protein